jgi:hypothetical protein
MGQNALMFAIQPLETLHICPKVAKQGRVGFFLIVQRDSRMLPKTAGMVIKLLSASNYLGQLINYDGMPV